MSAFIYFALIYLDVNTLRLLSYILFVLASADFRPPSTYIYREQPKRKSDSPKKNLSLTKAIDARHPPQSNAGTRPQPHPGTYTQIG